MNSTSMLSAEFFMVDVPLGSLRSSPAPAALPTNTSPGCISSLATSWSSTPTLSPILACWSCLRNVSIPATTACWLLVCPWMCTSSPTWRVLLSIRPVTTVPRPRIEKTSAIVIRNDGSVAMTTSPYSSCRCSRAWHNYTSCHWLRSTRLAGQDDLRVAWPIPEQAARRPGRELGANVGLEALTLVSEEMRRGERCREVVGKHGVDVLDDIGAARAEDPSRSTEPCARECIFESISGWWREPLSGAAARPEVALDERVDRVVGDRRVAWASRLRPARVRVNDQRQCAAWF